jgi:hypothetical protein
MPTNTYVALDKFTVGTATSSVTLSSISGSYTDLYIVIQAKGTNTSNTDLGLRFNSDTASNYSRIGIYGDGASAGTFVVANETSAKIGILPGTTNGAWNIMRVNLQSYSNGSIYKTLIARSDEATNLGTTSSASLWRSNSAVTSITFIPISGNIAVGSTFSLYGIKAETVPTAKATGGTIAYGVDGYTYHTFTAGGTFTPTQSLTCELLLIGGGGSGAAIYAEPSGGGAAGQVKLVTGVSASATGYAVVVGGGGTSSTSSSGNLGTSSSVLSQSATTAISNANNYNGGTSGNGFTGGGAPANTGGGGGGAGAVGQDGLGTYYVGTGGAGGAGVNTYSTWASITNTGVSGYYGGGGGGGGYVTGDNGGAGGAGGGGKGGSYQSGIAAVAGTANTGGGGGARANSGGSSGAGGSGLVIIRYVSA